MASARGSSNAAAGSPANQSSSAASASGSVQGAGTVPDSLQFLRFPHPILANVPAPQVITPLPGQRRRKKFDFTRLPDDIIFSIIKEQLTIYDRAALALVCKALAAKVLVMPSMLRINADDAEQEHITCHKFFRNTMKRWFPSHLKFCQICGKYVPRDTDYWTEMLSRQFSGRPGLLARNFKAWSASEDEMTNMDRQYRVWNEDSQCRTCPRCKLQTRHF